MLKKELTILVTLSIVAVGILVVSGVGGFFSGAQKNVPAPSAAIPSATKTPVGGYPSGYGAPTTMPGNDNTINDPGQSTAQPSATPMPDEGPAIISAELLGYGTDRDTYARGDTAILYMIVNNTGNRAINDLVLEASAYKSLPVLGYTKVSGPQEYSLTGQDIKPGESKRIEYLVIIPKSYQGISTAGDYEFSVSVKVAGISIGSFKQSIKVT